MENFIPFIILAAVLWVVIRKKKKLPIVPDAVSRKFGKGVDRGREP